MTTPVEVVPEPGALHLATRRQSQPRAARRTLAATRPAAEPRTPYLLLDVDLAVARFRELASLFGPHAIHYAVKANPHPALVSALVTTGCRFDVASPGEVDLCLGAGADPSSLVYSNPVKRRSDIASAFALGVRLFAADSIEEIVKLAAAAPGSDVLVRIGTSGAGSDWPLSGKFGCRPEEATALLLEAADRGLGAAGVSFHVGSQQRDPHRWDPPIAAAAAIFSQLQGAGLSPWLLDIGGGLPAAHEGDHPGVERYAAVIDASLAAHFGGDRPRLVVEPGRGIAGDAGTVVAEVLGVSWRSGRRWVYLDVGVYTGLVETLGESIRYRVEAAADPSVGDRALAPAVLAGPTCDSVDVLYEKVPVLLPVSLAEGDQIRFASAGAYTSSYSTVGFNGFDPLTTVLA